jgi:hypothetical protein
MERTTFILCFAIWSASVVVAYFIGSRGQEPSTTISPAPKAAAASVKETRIAEPIEIAVLPEESSSGMEADLAVEAMPPEEVLDKVFTLSNESMWGKLDDAFALPISDVKRSGQIIELLGLLAEIDPVAALELASSMQSFRDRSMARKSVLEAWGRNDPAAAIAWLTTGLEGDPKAVRNTMLSAIFRGYAESNPAAAFEEALTISDKKLLQSCLTDVVRTQIASGGVLEAKEAIELLPASGPRSALRSVLVNEWVEFDPTAAADYVYSLDPDETPRLKWFLVKDWAKNDPAAAAAWLSDLPLNDPAIDMGSTSIIKEWTRYDLVAPAEWLSSLPASENFNRAVATYAISAAQEDPRAAMVWSESVVGDKSRKWAMKEVGKIWSAQDPEGYKSYMDHSEFSAEH